MYVGLWVVNEEFYANKRACTEPNVEILEFMMKEHDPKGIPHEIQNISNMVEMALMAESMQDLVEKTPELGATEMKAGPPCKFDKIRLPHESAGNSPILDPCICRLTSMELYKMLGHMGGGKGFPPRSVAPPWCVVLCPMPSGTAGCCFRVLRIRMGLYPRGSGTQPPVLPIVAGLLAAVAAQLGCARARVSEWVGHGSPLYLQKAATHGQRIHDPRIRSALYPRSAATAALCCRGGRLRAAAQPRRGDTLGVCIRGRRIYARIVPEYRGNTFKRIRVPRKHN
jgi:hypothetical protein